jgi:hypothetical protein
MWKRVQWQFIRDNEDITATIHYSSYVYDEEKIDLRFLKNYLKSPEFIDAIKGTGSRWNKNRDKIKTHSGFENIYTY